MTMTTTLTLSVAQGNVRMLWLRDAQGRTVARSTARLLARNDTRAPNSNPNPNPSPSPNPKPSTYS